MSAIFSWWILCYNRLVLCLAVSYTISLRDVFTFHPKIHFSPSHSCLVDVGCAVATVLCGCFSFLCGVLSFSNTFIHSLALASVACVYYVPSDDWLSYSFKCHSHHRIHTHTHTFIYTDDDCLSCVFDACGMIAFTHVNIMYLLRDPLAKQRRKKRANTIFWFWFSFVCLSMVSRTFLFDGTGVGDANCIRYGESACYTFYINNVIKYLIPYLAFKAILAEICRNWNRRKCSDKTLNLIALVYTFRAF